MSSRVEGALKFLIDEDVPTKLLSVLHTAGHDVRRVAPSTPDDTIAHQALSEARILVTLDKDFANTRRYPPEQHTIIHIRIHPPYASHIIQAVTTLLVRLPPAQLRGLIVLQQAGSIRIVR